MPIFSFEFIILAYVKVYEYIYLMIRISLYSDIFFYPINISLFAFKPNMFSNNRTLLSDKFNFGILVI